MAIFHCNVSYGARCSGQSAVAKADYVTRQGQYADRDDLAASESGNLPAFAAHDASIFWRAADEYSRANGRLFNEVEVALPAELDLAQNIELVRGFVRKITTEHEGGSGQIPFTWAIHKKAGNPHVHIELAAKLEDGLNRSDKVWFSRAATGHKPPEAGGARAWSAQGKAASSAWVLEIRKTWAEHVNFALSRAGRVEIIDHRSNADRGMTELPTGHEGYRHRTRAEALKRNKRVREINALTHKIAGLRADVAEEGFTRDEYRQFRRAKLALASQKRIAGKKRRAPADAATQRAVVEAHAKAVCERVAALERRESLASSSLSSHQAIAAAAEAAAVLRRQWRAGFDRLQVSRKLATIADREAAVLAANKKVELISATAVPPVGLFGGKAKQEAHDLAAAKKAERLGRAERARDIAQASLDAGWSEIDDKLEQNRAAAAAVAKAARQARAVELTQLRAQIEAFPAEAATIATAVDRERIAEVRDRAIADAAKLVTDEEASAAAEQLRISLRLRRLDGGHTPV